MVDISRNPLAPRPAAWLAVACVALAMSGLGPRPCAAAASDLDPTFADGGVAIVSVAGHMDAASAVAVQPDGKLVVAGRARACESCLEGFGLARFLPDGTLDPSFGEGGVVQTVFGERGAHARDVAIAPDGRIVAVGSTYVGALGRYTLIFDMAVARYLPDGRLDKAFGDEGRATANFGARISVAEAVVLQPDGRIVAAGHSYQMMIFDDKPIVARFGTDGTLDRTFGPGGTIKLPHSSSVHGAALQPDGRIVLAGGTSNVVVTTERDLVLYRLMPDGQLDPSFGQGGSVLIDLTGRGEIARAVAVLEDGRIVATAQVVPEARDPQLFLVAQFAADGRLDRTFGAGGFAVTESLGLHCVDGPGLAVQPDGGLVLAGEKDFGAARFDSTGRLDPTFAPDGTAFAGRPGLFCAADVAVQDNGAVVVVGSQQDGDVARFVVARFEGQAPGLAGTVDRSAPQPGDPVTFRFTVSNGGYVPFRGGRLTVVVPEALAAIGPVVVDPPGGGSAAGVRLVVDNVAVEPGRSMTVTVPTQLGPGVAPGTPLAVTATLEPGSGHHPVAVVVALVTQGPPIAAPDRALTAVDTPVRIDVLANDSDPNGDAIRVTAVMVPERGSAVTDGATVTYTPMGGFVGEATFSYFVTDGIGTSEGAVTVRVAERLFPVFVPVVARTRR